MSGRVLLTSQRPLFLRKDEFSSFPSSDTYMTSSREDKPKTGVACAYIWHAPSVSAWKITPVLLSPSPTRNSCEQTQIRQPFETVFYHQTPETGFSKHREENGPRLREPKPRHDEMPHLGRLHLNCPRTMFTFQDGPDENRGESCFAVEYGTSRVDLVGCPPYHWYDNETLIGYQDDENAGHLCSLRGTEGRSWYLAKNGLLSFPSPTRGTTTRHKTPL